MRPIPPILRIPSGRLLLACLLGASMLCSLLGRGVSHRVRSAVAVVLTPFGDAGMYLATSFDRDVEGLARRSVSAGEATRLADDNERLRRKLDSLSNELADLIARDAAMDRLYGPIPYAQWRLIPATVVAADALPYGRMRTLNAGSALGVAAGSLVTTRSLITDRSKAMPEGFAAVSPLPESLDGVSEAVLVGRISRTGAHTAGLRLVSDRDFAVGARIRRVLDPARPRKFTRTGPDARETDLTEQNNAPVDAAAAGDGAGGMTIAGVYAMENVQPGDVVVTSGSDGLLPAEVRIGKVVEVTDDPERKGLFVNLKVRPESDAATLREVYIVVPGGTGPGGAGPGGAGPGGAGPGGTGPAGAGPAEAPR
jgi:cell shape-determining protein MreC